MLPFRITFAYLQHTPDIQGRTRRSQVGKACSSAGSDRRHCLGYYTQTLPPSMVVANIYHRKSSILEVDPKVHCKKVEKRSYISLNQRKTTSAGCRSLLCSVCSLYMTAGCYVSYVTTFLASCGEILMPRVFLP